MASDADKLGNLVVLDYGSDTIKAGLAKSLPDENALSCVTPSLVSCGGGGGAAGEGPAAGPSGGGGGGEGVRAAVRGGRIIDFEAMEALMHHILYERCGWRPGREDTLLVITPVLASRAEREALGRLAFEEFRVRGLFFSDAAACSIFAANKQVGLAVDIGHEKAVVASVSEGTTHVAGAAALPWAGAQLSEHVCALLAASGDAATAAAAAGLSGQQLRAIKEAAACVASSAEAYADLTAPGAAAAGGGKRYAAAEKASAAAGASKAQEQDMEGHLAEWRRARGGYTLPDGTRLQLGAAGYQLGEALLRPATAGLAAPPLGLVCCEVVGAQMEPAVRKAVWDNIVVTGGGANIPGIEKRLLVDLPLYHSNSNPNACGVAAIPHYLPPPARQHAAWFGGAVLARVAMHQMIGANEYDEFGPAVVNKVVL